MKVKHSRSRGRWLAGIGLIGILVATLAASAASASFPGKDGLLLTFAFDFDADQEALVTIDPELGATQELLADADYYLGDPHRSPYGELVAFTRLSNGPGPSPSTVWTVNADGSGEQMVGRGIVLDFSPGEGKILISSEKGDLAVMNVDGSRRRTILKRSQLQRRGKGYLSNAAWSPTGKLIAYDTTKSGSGTSKRSLYVVRPNGTGRRPLPSLSGAVDPDWAPDGKTIYYERNTKVPVKILSLKLGAKRPVKLTKGYAPAISPSGKMLAFARIDDIYTMRLPRGKPKKLELRPETDIDPASAGIDWQPMP